MNSTARGLITIVTMTLFVFIYLITSNLSISSEHKKSLKEISKVVKLPGVSHSTSSTEKRIGAYDDYSNDFYLGMRKESYRGFVYAK